MATVTLNECKAYAARMLNSIRASEGNAPYSDAEISAWWDELLPTERVEWEDDALADRMDRT